MTLIGNLTSRPYPDALASSQERGGCPPYPIPMIRDGVFWFLKKIFPKPLTLRRRQVFYIVEGVSLRMIFVESEVDYGLHDEF